MQCRKKGAVRVAASIDGVLDLLGPNDILFSRYRQDLHQLPVLEVLGYAADELWVREECAPGGRGEVLADWRLLFSGGAGHWRCNALSGHRLIELVG